MRVPCRQHVCTSGEAEGKWTQARNHDTENPACCREDAAQPRPPLSLFASLNRVSDLTRGQDAPFPRLEPGLPDRLGWPRLPYSRSPRRFEHLFSNFCSVSTESIAVKMWPSQSSISSQSRAQCLSPSTPSHISAQLHPESCSFASSCPTRRSILLTAASQLRSPR